MRPVDLVVVGGGSAGFAAAIKGAELKARVALVEGGTLGGTCVNVGCVPSKTLIRAAEAHHRRTHHPFDGIARSDGRPEWAAVRDQKDALVEKLRRTKYADVLAAYDRITLFRGRATLTAGPAVRLSDGRTIVASKVIVATGASPWAPPIPGLHEAGFLDSTSAMAQAALPASLIVLGGGAVGLELAQTFSRLGVAVTVLEAVPRLLPGEDGTVGEGLRRALIEEGMTVHTGVRVEGVERRRGEHTVGFSRDGVADTVRGGALLVATGRRANTTGLALEEAGVGLGAKGEILTDEFLQTANPNVYAAGDVIGDPMFVYVAAHAGATAAENALGVGNTRRFDLTALPRVTFTDPAVAAVGRTEKEVRADGIEPIVSTLSLDYVPRALAARDARGFVQLVADAGTRRLLGAHILAAEAGEMITEAALAIKYGLTIDDLASTFHPYLTLSEGIKLAAQTFEKDVAKLSCCAA